MECSVYQSRKSVFAFKVIFLMMFFLPLLLPLLLDASSLSRSLIAFFRASLNGLNEEEGDIKPNPEGGILTLWSDVLEASLPPPCALKLFRIMELLAAEPTMEPNIFE